MYSLDVIECVLYVHIPEAESHGLSSGSGLVQERGVGHIHGRQVTDHGLVVHQTLQPSLGQLCLVGGVGCDPGER